MTDNECRCRIREASTARLRVLGDAPTELDVTYSVSGNTVVLHSDHRATSAVQYTRRSALLEIDSGPSAATARWRVVVSGRCEPVASGRDQTSDCAAELWSVDGLELRIEFLEGRHGVPDALPPGSVVPPPRRATS